MNKFTFYLSMLFLMSIGSQAQVQVGYETNAAGGYYNDGGKTASFKVPFYAPFDYSYGQSIYLNSEINAAGNITSIQWYYSGLNDAPTAMPNSQDLVIYLGHTSKTKFDNVGDFVPVSGLTQVYSGGIITNSTPGWKTITFDTPFAYNGTDNLVVAVDENTPGHDTFSDVFYCSAVADYRSITSWSSSYNVDPANPYSMGDVKYGATTAGYTNHVPNVIFGGLTQSCATPANLIISNLNSKNATVSWDVPKVLPAAGSDYYLTTSSTPPNMFTTPTGHIASGNSVNLSSLTPGTSYNLWVRNDCSTDLVSFWVQKTFTTSCAGVAEFYENFDTVITPNLPTCWTKIMRGTAVNDASILNTVAYTPAISSPNTTEIVCTKFTSDAILVSPMVSNLADGTHRLVFYSRGRNCVLEIGTLDKASNDAVFTPIGTFPVDGNMTKNIISIPPSHVGDNFIGFRLNKVNSVFSSGVPAPWADIDNVSWETIPFCPDATKVKILSTDASEAYLGWDAVSADQYQIVYGDKSQTNPNFLTPLDPTSTLNQLLSNLNAGSGYNVWIRSVCSGNFGAWQGPVTFYTACNPVDTFVQNFDASGTPNLPVCWNQIVRGATVTAYSYVQTQTKTPTVTNDLVVEMHSFSSSSTDDIILVTPTLSTLNLGTYRLRFFAKKNDNNVTLQVGTVNTNTSEAKFTNFQNISLSQNWSEYIVDFTDYPVTDKFIGIRLNNIDINSFVDIDNVIWELSPLCADVTQVKLKVIKPNSAVVTWVEGMSETKWDLVYGSTSVTDPNSLTPISISGTPTYGISGLTPNTSYNVWIRSVCSGTNIGGWIGPVTFTTVCAPIDSLNESFESITTPSLPLCWTKLLVNIDTTSPIPANIKTVSGSLMPDATKDVVLNSSNAGPDAKIILITPYLSNLGQGTYRLRFKLKGNGTVYVGTLDSNLDTAVFTSLQTIMPSSNPTEYTVNFDTYTGSDNYVGIRLSTDIAHSYDEIDNIIWEPIPACQDVINLKQIESTMTTVTVAWDANSAIKWQYTLGDLSATNPDGLNQILTDAPSKVLGQDSPLQPGTTYKLWVRSFCEAKTQYGNWNGPIIVKTQCTEVNVPYVENFESAQGSNLPDCTSSINLADEPYNWYVGNNPGFGFGSKTLIYAGDLYTDADAWFFTRGITLEGGKNYNVSYRYGGANDDSALGIYENKLKVMYGQQANATAMTYLVKDYPSLFVKNPVPQTINITPATSGVYYFGFNVYSPNNSYYMFIDDISVDFNLATDQFEVSELSYYPNPIKDIFNINNDSDIKSVTVYNVLGQEVLLKIINAQSAKIDMANLLSGTYIVKIATENGTKTIKAIKQ